MNLKSTLLLSSAIALSLIGSPLKPMSVQAAEAPTKKTDLGIDFKLNAQQRKAIEVIGDFAIDQMEELVVNGLDPKKINSAETERRSQNLRQVFSNFRLDNQQKEALRTILQTARQQMRRQIQE